MKDVTVQLGLGSITEYFGPGRTYRFLEPLLRGDAQSLTALPFRMVDGLLIDRSVPIRMSNQLMLKAGDGMGHITEVVAVQATPIDEINAALPTGTVSISLVTWADAQKRMKVPLAI